MLSFQSKKDPPQYLKIYLTVTSTTLWMMAQSLLFLLIAIAK